MSNLNLTSLISDNSNIKIKKFCISDEYKELETIKVYLDNKKFLIFKNNQDIGIESLSMPEEDCLLVKFRKAEKQFFEDKDKFLEILIYKHNDKIFSIFGTYNDDQIEKWCKLLDKIGLNIYQFKQKKCNLPNNLLKWLQYKDKLKQKYLTESIYLNKIGNAKNNITESEQSDICFKVRNSLMDISEANYCLLKDRIVQDLVVVFEEKKDKNVFYLKVSSDYSIEIYSSSRDFNENPKIINNVQKVLYVVNTLLPELKKEFDKLSKDEFNKIEFIAKTKCLSEIFSELKTITINTVDKYSKNASSEISSAIKGERNQQLELSLFPQDTRTTLEATFYGLKELYNSIGNLLNTEENCIKTLINHGILMEGDDILVKVNDECIDGNVCKNCITLTHNGQNKEYAYLSDITKYFTNPILLIRKPDGQESKIADIIEKNKLALFINKYSNNN